MNVKGGWSPSTGAVGNSQIECSDIQGQQEPVNTTDHKYLSQFIVINKNLNVKYLN